MSIGQVSFAPQFVVYAVNSDGVYSTVTDRVTWTISNPEIMQQVSSGFFFVRQPGAVDFYATYQGAVGSLSLQIRPAPSYPYLEIDTFIGATVNLVSAANVRQNVTNSVTWTTSNPAIATVDAKGAVTGVAPGNVEITASFNGLSDSYWVATPPRGVER